jgi:hypothetical protein
MVFVAEISYLSSVSNSRIERCEKILTTLRVFGAMSPERISAKTLIPTKLLIFILNFSKSLFISDQKDLNLHSS